MYVYSFRMAMQKLRYFFFTFNNIAEIRRGFLKSPSYQCLDFYMIFRDYGTCKYFFSLFHHYIHFKYSVCIQLTYNKTLINKPNTAWDDKYALTSSLQNIAHKAHQCLLPIFSDWFVVCPCTFWWPLFHVCFSSLLKHISYVYLSYCLFLSTFQHRVWSLLYVRV